MELFDRGNEVDSRSKAPWAAVFGALFLAVLNVGQFIQYDASFSVLSLNVKDVRTLFTFSLFLLGPFYSWYLVKVSNITNTLVGFYLGASTVTLLQFLATMTLRSSSALGGG